MLWDIVEKVSGIDRRHIKELIRDKANDYVQRNTCTCGCIKWMHKNSQGACAGCNKCNDFKAIS